MNGIIDCHVHHYPPKVIADPAGWASRMGETHWAALMSRPGKHPQGWADSRQLIGDMDAAGVEKVVLTGWYWEHQETCELQNAYFLQCVRDEPDRFLALAAVQPAAGLHAFDETRRAVEEGCAGIGEILPRAQRFEMRNHTWLKICEWAEAQGVPVNLHATETAGHEYAGRMPTPLDEYLWLAGQFYDLKIILSHWGGGLPFYELNPKVRRNLKNVFYDTAASPLLYESRVWQTVCNITGPDKILFGSDYPLILYPKKRDRPDFACLIEEAQQSGLSGAALGKILSANARRIFGLG